jgi:hypothetical protein
MITHNKKNEIIALFREIRRSEAKGFTPVCMVLCERGMMSVTVADFTNYFRFGLRLARYLINDPELEDVDRAIRVLQDLEKRAPRLARIEKAKCQMFLGFAYQNRKKGSKQKNLKEAKKWYGLALEAFSRQRHPKECAMISAALAEVYAGLTEGDSGPNLEKAIQLTTAALSIYTSKRFPEDNKTYSLALEKLKRKRSGARRQAVL